MPEIAPSSVLLPAPLAPNTATISPWRAWKLNPRRAWECPWNTLSPFTFSKLILIFLPEIGFYYLSITLNLFRSPFGDSHPKIQNQDPVGNLHHSIHVVFHQNY